MYKPFDLTNKTALITGGNSGIGLGMAQALADSGARVAIWGTNADKNARAVADIAKRRDGCAAFACDVSDEAAVDAVFAETLQALGGRIDAVFANAGISGGAGATGAAPPPFESMRTEEWRRVMQVNLDGAFFTLRAGARHMVERARNGDKGGSLVVTASLAAIEGAARSQHYAATKGAVISMMRGLAVEFARYGVRANAILPGWIATDMTAPAQASDAFSSKVVPRIPARRWGESDDFGGVAIYLTSDASSYHSGDCLVVDGGYAVF